MLFQPSNIYPSTFSGIGAGTVDVTQGLNVSWQVNGDTPMTAYQIKIYQNDSGSTLMYDSGSVSVSPVFEPHDKNGNATYFTAIISAAALSTAGIVNGYQYGYKMLITQWWGVSDYVEQTSASVFITRSTPTLAINTITTPVASNSLTITANYSQAQGDPISTVEWVFALAGSESTPIRETGAISTQVLSFDADGLITGNTYSIMCKVVTSTGMEASTGFVQFPVSYSSSSLGINYQLAQLKNSSAVYLSWDDLGSNILSYPYTDTTKTTNGITFTVNGEGDVVVTGTATADAYFTIAQGTLSQLGITAGQKFIVTSGYSGAKIVVTETNSSNVVVSTIEGSDPLQYIATSTTNTLKFSIVIPSGSVLSSGQQLKPMIAIEDKIVALNDVSVTMQPTQDLHGYDSPWIGTDYDKQPYNFRAVSSSSVSPLGNSEMGNIVGGTVAWNQLYPTPTTTPGTTEAFPVGTTFRTNGKYLAVFNGGKVDADGANPVICIYVGKDSGMQKRVYAGSSTVFNCTISATADGTKNDNANSCWVYKANGDNLNFNSFCVFDLTAMFGSTIADYIYGLEQNTAGAGVAWFKKLFPKDYYAYDAGSLLSVKTSAHKTVGFNALSPENLKQSGNANVVTISNIPVVAGQSYELNWETLDFTGGGVYLHEHDSFGNQIKQNAVYNTIFHSLAVTLQSNTVSVSLNVYKTGVTLADVLAANLCLHLVWDGERDGEYEPYEEHTYPLDDVELRGIPKLDASNNLYYDGDSYAPDGTVTRKFFIKTFDGTDPIQVWYDADAEKNNWGFYINIPSQLNCGYGKPISPNFTAVSAVYSTDSPWIMSIHNTAGTAGYLAFRIPKSVIGTPSDANDLVTKIKAWIALNQFQVQLELATPATESADPYQETQVCNDFGTEEYVDAGVAAGTRDVAIPVGHYTNYANICPITGRTGLSVYVGPTQDQQDATTYAVDWTSEAGTVYGGTLDVVTGVLTVDRAMVDLGSLVWNYNTTYAFFTSNSILTRKIGVLNVWSDLFKTMGGSWSGTPAQNALWGNGSNTTLYVQIPPLDNVDDFMALVDGHQLMYELATPLTYQLTPQEVEALVGTNNVWSTGDSVSVTYTKDTGSQATLSGAIVTFSDSNAVLIPTPQYIPGITGISIYRYLQGESALQHVYDLATGATSILDYYAPSQMQVSYLIVAHSGIGDLFLQTTKFTPTFWFFSILLCDTDSNGDYHVSKEYIFKYGVETGAVSNNNDPTIQKNFTPYPNRQPISSLYKTGKLTSYIGKTNSQNQYSDSVSLQNAIYDISTSPLTKFLKTRKGDILMIDTAAAIQMKTEDATTQQALRATVDWVEVGDASNKSIVSVPTDSFWPIS